MEDFTVCFFGHRSIENALQIEKRLDRHIRQLLIEKGCVEFLVGRDGDFDLMAASAVKRAKRTIRDDNSILVWVLPYATADLESNYKTYEQYYDEIEINDSGAHYKAAFQIRNRTMVDRADLVICYITKRSGGAYKAIQYAQKQGKTIINIACENE